MSKTPLIVYFSNVSGNTHRFVTKLGMKAERIPLRRKDGELLVDEPYVLITPTYGQGEFTRAVPKQVGKFLNNRDNRMQMRGVIGSGNTNFGTDYCLAGELIAKKVKIPLLYKFELLGTNEDVDAIQRGLEKFWKSTK